MSLEHSPARSRQQAVYTVPEFCEAHRIIRSTLYNLWDLGQGPRVMRVGKRRLITQEAAAEWRTAFENSPNAA
jgi:hypothetical protein